MANPKTSTVTVRFRITGDPVRLNHDVVIADIVAAAKSGAFRDVIDPRGYLGDIVQVDAEIVNICETCDKPLQLVGRSWLHVIPSAISGHVPAPPGTPICEMCRHPVERKGRGWTHCGVSSYGDIDEIYGHKPSVAFSRAKRGAKKR